jgi:hypothetical protein
MEGEARNRLVIAMISVTLALGACRSEGKIPSIAILVRGDRPVSIMTATCGGEDVRRVAIEQTAAGTRASEKVRWEIRATGPSLFPSIGGSSSGHIYDVGDERPGFEVTQEPRLDVPEETPLRAVIDTNLREERYYLRFRLSELNGLDADHVITLSKRDRIMTYSQWNDRSTEDCPEPK